MFLSVGLAAPVSRPFIIDLESTNGTIVNDEPIPTSRYYELMLGDGAAFSFICTMIRTFVLIQLE